MSSIKPYQAVAVMRVVHDVGGTSALKSVAVDGKAVARIEDVLELGRKTLKGAYQKPDPKRRNEPLRRLSRLAAVSATLFGRVATSAGQALATSASLAVRPFVAPFRPLIGSLTKQGQRIRDWMDTEGPRATGFKKIFYTVYQRGVRPVPTQVLDVVHDAKLEVELKSGERFSVDAKVLDVKASLRVQRREQLAILPCFAPMPPGIGFVYGTAVGAISTGLAALWAKHASGKGDVALKRAYHGMIDRQVWLAASSLIPGYSLAMTAYAASTIPPHLRSLKRQTTVEEVVTLGARTPARD